MICVGFLQEVPLSSACSSKTINYFLIMIPRRAIKVRVGLKRHTNTHKWTPHFVGGHFFFVILAEQMQYLYICVLLLSVSDTPSRPSVAHSSLMMQRVGSSRRLLPIRFGFLKGPFRDMFLAQLLRRHRFCCLPPLWRGHLARFRGVRNEHWWRPYFHG